MSGAWAGRLLALALLPAVVVAGDGWAQSPPRTQPASARQDVAARWDRSALPGDIELWPPRTVLGYDRDAGGAHAALFLTCSADGADGRCPRHDTGETGASRSTVAVSFSERRSGMRTTLDVTGWIERIDADQDCHAGYWDATPRALWSSAAAPCGTAPGGGTGAALRVPAGELEKLVAGHWTARLQLVLRRPPDEAVATYVFDFAFTVTDHDAAAIYFPAFGQGAAEIGLDLRHDPLTRRLDGRALLDMCLYDGQGSSSGSLGLTVRDAGRRRGPAGFALWHEQGGSDDAQRLDYSVRVEHAGARLLLVDGVEQALRGIDDAALRRVVLPGMTRPVHCLPAPLTFEAHDIPIGSKRPGRYSGGLQVELRVPTSRP